MYNSKKNIIAGRNPLIEALKQDQLIDKILLSKNASGDAINEIRTLAAIGIRLTVESLCAQKEAQGARLADQISDLHKKGFLTAEQTTGLHSIRFLGNDAAHDAAEPVDVELGAAMDVLDGVLDSVYVLPARRKRLAALRRQRKT